MRGASDDNISEKLSHFHYLDFAMSFAYDKNMNNKERVHQSIVKQSKKRKSDL
jgi:hypothetical protein